MALLEIAGKVIITELIKSSLPKVLKQLSGYADDIDHHYNDKLSKYLTTNYDKLNSSTSQLFRNQDFKINELYVPLTITNSATSKKTKINKFPKSLIDTEPNILINDTAGMGKSTLLKMIFRYSIDENQIIPFYIDMKSLIKDEKVTSVIDSFINNFPSYTKIPNQDFLQKLFELGNFIFLFDGADEVADSFKDEVYSEINKFVDIATESKFIIATRDEDKILSSFNHFKSFRINELEKEEAYQLIRNYDVKNEIAEKLISEINKEENLPVLEFLKNPLLGTLLYTAYSFSKKIPLKKNLFYKQVYESLYENHDATKIGFLSREKKSGLDIDDFEIILSQFAFLGRLEEKLEYKHSEIMIILDKINDSHPTINFKSRDFIHDMLSRVPILRKDGQYLIWQHKSIQEYFFIRFITKVMNETQRVNIISNMLKSKNIDKYKLIFDILYDEDVEFFHDNITLNIFEEYQNQVKDTDNLCDNIDYFYKYWISDDFQHTVDIFDSGNSIHTHIVEEKIYPKLSKSQIQLMEDRYIVTHLFIMHDSAFMLELSHKHTILISLLHNKGYEFLYKYTNTNTNTNTKHFNSDVIKKLLKQVNPLENVLSKSNEKLINDILDINNRYILIDGIKLNKFIKDYKTKRIKKKSLIEDLGDYTF